MVVSINIDETVLRPNVRPAKPKSKRGPITFFVDIEAPNGRSVKRSLVRGVDDLNDDYEQPPAAISLGTLLLSLSLSSTFYWDTPVAFDPVTADFFLQQFEVGVGGNIDVPGLELSVDMETTAEASISRAPIIVDLTLPQFTTNKTITFEPIDIGLSLPTLETKVETSLDIITVDLTVPALNTDKATNFEALSLSMSLPDAEIASDIYGELAVVNLSVAGTLDTGININLPASMESAQDDDVATIGSPSLLLDTYSGAAAAYSIRKLSTSYSGSAIRIREDGGDTETDIGFDSNGDLNTADIASWCGSNNGYVVTWYDQSGNGNDATQGNAANQPRIYNGTTHATMGSRPAIEWVNGSNHWLDCTFPSRLTQPFTTFAACRYNGASGQQEYLFDSMSSSYRAAFFHLSTNDKYQMFASTGTITSDNADTTAGLRLLGGVWNGSSSLMRINGTSQTDTSIGTNDMDGLTIGNYFARPSWNSAYNWDDVIAEIVIYDSDQSTDLSGIESDINTYYSIYS